MTYRLKPVQCGNCKHWNRNKAYVYDGKCNKDGRTSHEWNVCNLLPTNDDRRNAKIEKYK